MILFFENDFFLYKKRGTKPIKHVIWPSWPHMWAAPMFFDLYDKLVNYIIDNASISARNAMQRSYPDDYNYPLRSTTRAVGLSYFIHSF